MVRVSPLFTAGVLLQRHAIEFRRVYRVTGAEEFCDGLGDEILFIDINNRPCVARTVVGDGQPGVTVTEGW